MNTQIIAIANQKGDVGKTTTCANLGIGLAQAGKKVLLIDGDPQGSLTISLGHPQPDKLPFTLSDAMGRILMDEPMRPGEGILHHPEGVDLMPADIQLSGMEVSLVNAMSRETILRQYLDTLKGQYSNNYLEQKRIKRDESEFVYVKGGFPQIISEEQYERCNAIRRSRTKRLTDEKGRTRSFGIQQAQNVWGRKMRCRCGSPMLRHRWRTNNAGKPIYGYECKRHHDTPRIRLQNEQGNPTPICEIKPVGQSKLELMASKIFERVWGDQREIVLQTCKMLDACYKPDADRRADLMKAKDDSIQLLQQQLDDLVVVRARGEIEQDKFLQRTIEIQQQMEALRQSKAQIASEDYNPGRLDMEAIEAALCEAVEMHDGLVSEDFIDLFVSQVTPLSDSRFAWCLDFSPQPTVAFLNLAGQRKYTTCSMDSKLHFGPFADEEGHTIPFPGSLRR